MPGVVLVGQGDEAAPRRRERERALEVAVEAEPARRARDDEAIVVRDHRLQRGEAVGRRAVVADHADPVRVGLRADRVDLAAEQVERRLEGRHADGHLGARARDRRVGRARPGSGRAPPRARRRRRAGRAGRARPPGRPRRRSGRGPRSRWRSSRPRAGCAARRAAACRARARPAALRPRAARARRSAAPGTKQVPHTKTAVPAPTPTASGSGASSCDVQVAVGRHRVDEPSLRLDSPARGAKAAAARPPCQRSRALGPLAAEPGRAAAAVPGRRGRALGDGGRGLRRRPDRRAGRLGARGRRARDRDRSGTAGAARRAGAGAAGARARARHQRGRAGAASRAPTPS